jgi:Lipocalin-like domain
MARFLALLVAVYFHFQPGLVFADDTSKLLVGSWKLTSWTIQIVGGDSTEPFGPNPKGRAVFTPNGYAAFIIVGANRKPATNNDETAALLKSLLVYTGKFTIDGGKFTTKVDMSGNEILTGQDQVRFFKLEGDRLSIRTAEQVSSVYQGKKVVGTLAWERER